MGDLESDAFERRSDAQIARERADELQREADLRRRGQMTEHQRDVEDVIAEYTTAVKCGATQEFFERMAGARTRLRTLEASERRRGAAIAQATKRCEALKENLEEFIAAADIEKV